MIVSRIAVVLASRAKPCQCGLRCKCSICILMSPGLLPVRDEKFILLRHFSTFLWYGTKIKKKTTLCLYAYLSKLRCGRVLDQQLWSNCWLADDRSWTKIGASFQLSRKLYSSLDCSFSTFLCRRKNTDQLTHFCWHLHAWASSEPTFIKLSYNLVQMLIVLYVYSYLKDLVTQVLFESKVQRKV